MCPPLEFLPEADVKIFGNEKRINPSVDEGSNPIWALIPIIPGFYGISPDLWAAFMVAIKQPKTGNKGRGGKIPNPGSREGISGGFRNLSMGTGRRREFGGGCCDLGLKMRFGVINGIWG